MRTLKRPMFRMGGMSNEGIMSGIRPRQNYAETGAVKDYYGDAEKIITERIGDNKSKMDPLTQFLLTYGPSLASNVGPGGFINRAVGAAEKPLANTIQAVKDDEKLARDIKLASIDLGESEKDRDLKRELADKKNTLDLLPTFLDQYEGNLNEATNRNTYEKSGLEIIAKEKFGDNYAGLGGGNIHGDLNSKSMKTKKNVGKVYYDVTDGKFKRLRRTEEGFSYEIIDIEKFSKADDDAKKAPKESFPGEFSKNPAYRRPPKQGFKFQPKDPFDPYGGA
tara:strand:- start:432 stop:1268 length:837 start_codon:yes stop_codon:yes gene_type:complete